MVKTNPKMVKRQFYFACLSRYNNPTFYKKKFPLHNPFKGIGWVVATFFLTGIIAGTGVLALPAAMLGAGRSYSSV